VFFFYFIILNVNFISLTQLILAKFSLCEIRPGQLHKIKTD